ncbi:MAG: Hpt domain-containing protein [Bacteroidia bacterium]|nr:Hpt domain-containing protein [Bacteroidia bacterium]
MENEKKYVDISFLKNLTGGDNVVISEVINLFKMEVPRYIQELNTALNNKNWDELAAVAHKAKSSFALMGINDVVTDLKKLETLSKDEKNTDSISDIVKNVEAIYLSSVKELEDQMGQN